MSSERDWTTLLPELIHLVSKRLPDLRYFIRCRAVCKRWFSSIILSDPPQQQLPWLIEDGRQFPQASPLKEELRFYSFVSGETGSIPIQKQIEAAHTPLALTLRSLMFELLDWKRKLLSMVAAGNPKVFNPVAMQATNGLMPGFPNVHEAPLDPTKELAQLISERKYEEAFNAALQSTDISMVSWLCSQVDLHELCTMVPIPLTQAVLLALLQQLACDIANDTAQKATWMTDVAVTINPSDPSIAVLVRPIFNHVYKIVSNHQATLASDAAKIKIVIHVINSVLVGFK